jgi:hypothetical protein
VKGVWVRASPYPPLPRGPDAWLIFDVDAVDGERSARRSRGPVRISV